MENKQIKVIAELVISPVGVGESLSQYVKAAVTTIESYKNVRIIKHPMGTVIEADTIEEILEITKHAHNSIFEVGASRVVTRLTIDDRRDKPRNMEDKIAAVN